MTMRPANEQFRRARRELGYTQKTLAAMLGVTVLTINRWEQAKGDVPFAAEAVVRIILYEKRNPNKTIADLRKYLTRIRANRWPPTPQLRKSKQKVVRYERRKG